MKKELLRVDNGHVLSGSIGALNGFCLSLMAGESLGVMFDNLREKEAFIKLLQGDLPLVQGRVYVDEQLAADPRALRGAIHMVAGCSALARGLSIAENVYYKQLPGCFFSTDIYEEMLQDLMERFQVDVNVRAPLDGLTHAESVAIELMKACTSGRKIVVLADMTGYLSHDELTRILDVADRMRGAGYAFIIIESCWEPVFGRADSIALIHQGRTQYFFKPEELIRARKRGLLWNVPVDPGAAFRELPEEQFGACPALALDDVCAGALSHVSFHIKRGELINILYSDERSMKDLIALLRGDRAAESGCVYVNGEPVRFRRFQRARKREICFVEDSPHLRSVIRNMSVFDNVAFALSDKVRMLWLRGRYQRSLRRTLAKLCGEDLWDCPIRSLSPVQVQKIVYGKWILYHPSVVVCQNPYIGMDHHVDAVTEGMIRNMLAMHISVITLSFHLSTSSLEGRTLYLQNGTISI
jgi:ribose transport system ATP-binding protein